MTLAGVNPLIKIYLCLNLNFYSLNIDQIDNQTKTSLTP